MGRRDVCGKQEWEETGSRAAHIRQLMDGWGELLQVQTEVTRAAARSPPKAYRHQLDTGADPDPNYHLCGIKRGRA